MKVLNFRINEDNEERYNEILILLGSGGQMLTYHERRRLTNKFNKWIQKCRIHEGFEPLESPQTVIDWLVIEKLVDEDKIREFLTK